MKENAAETCRTECELTVGALVTAVKDDAAARTKHKDSFDACYSKCTAESAQEVAVERVKVSKEPSCDVYLSFCMAITPLI